jgi:hypothetical protein
MRETAAALLQRAQRAGAIRPGIDAWDLLILANGIALAARDAGQARRLLTTIRHGLDDNPVPDAGTDRAPAFDQRVRVGTVEGASETGKPGFTRPSPRPRSVPAW